MKDKKSNIWTYLISLLLVLGIFILTLIITNTAPFGNNVLGDGDALSQYKPMLYNFIMGIKTGALESYSFGNGLGNPIIFNFIYYLISPFNMIAILFKDADLMFLSVILLKIAVATITMTFYAKRKGASNFVSIIVAISYVFSGWLMANCYNIMWLDIFALFPLFQYSLEKLIKDNKCLLYIFMLGLLIVVNFYQSFSVIIYSICYFIIYNFFYKKDKIKEKVKTLGLFVGSCIISFLLISCYLYLLVIVNKKMNIGFIDMSEYNYVISAMDFIKSIFYGVVNITREKMGHVFPNICVNTLILVGSISFFFNKKIDIRDRIFAFIGLDLIVLCIFLQQLDYVPMFGGIIESTYIYSYIISFLMIILFIKNIQCFELIKKKIYIILLVLLIILGINYRELEFNVFVLNLITLLSLGVFVLFYSENRIYKCIILSILIIQVLIVSTYNLSFDISKDSEGEKNSYIVNNFKYRLNSVNDVDFLNQNMYYNHNVLYLYSAMSYKDVINMITSLGCNSGTNVMSCNSDDKIVNMIFNVKNDYYLEKIYSVNKDIDKLILNDNDVKRSQEQLIELMTGITDIFDKEILIGKEDDDKIKFTTDKNYYLIDLNVEDGMKVNLSQGFNEFYIGKELNNSEVSIYTINEDKLKEIYEYLSKNQINYTYYSDSLIEGEIEVGENQMIFTSIPYDEDWHVYIDDKEVKTTRVLDEALLAINCASGKHKIKLEYKIDYIKPLMISLITFVSIIIYSVLRVIKNKKEE